MNYPRLRDIQQMLNITQPRSRGADTKFKVRLTLKFMLPDCGASVGSPLWGTGTLVSSAPGPFWICTCGPWNVTSVFRMWWAFDLCFWTTTITDLWNQKIQIQLKNYHFVKNVLSLDEQLWGLQWDLLSHGLNLTYIAGITEPDIMHQRKTEPIHETFVSLQMGKKKGSEIEQSAWPVRSPTSLGCSVLLFLKELDLHSLWTGQILPWQDNKL